MARLELVPFSDEHLDDAAHLLAARHARHREVEPLRKERLGLALTGMPGREQVRSVIQVLV